MIDNDFDPTQDVEDFGPELRPELLSIQSLVPYVDSNAPARCVMFAGHFAQRPVISGSEPNYIQTGPEEEFGKYSFKIKMPEDGVVEEVIPRYEHNYVEDDKYPYAEPAETLVLYRSEETGRYGMVMVPYHLTHGSAFGFKYEPTEAVNRLQPGMAFRKDTVFADSPAVKENDHYSYARNLNGCFMSHKNVGLDGYVIARSALEHFKFRLYERRVVEFGSNSFLLNTYGDETHYKAYPDIGDMVRSDGLLVVSRMMDPLELPAVFSRNDTQRVDNIFDRPVYSRVGEGKVVDIVAIQSNTSNRVLSPELTAQTERYVRKTRRYYQSIVNFHNKVVADWRKAHPSQEQDPGLFSPELSNLIVYAMAIINQKTQHSLPLSLNYKKRPIDTWRLEFTIEYEMTPGRGAKFACQSGGNPFAPRRSNSALATLKLLGNPKATHHCETNAS